MIKKIKNKIKIQCIKWICSFLEIENYTINSDFSIDVNDSVSISHFNLKKLPIRFGGINGYFAIHGNNLRSLDEFPSSSISIVGYESNGLKSPIFEILDLVSYDKQKDFIFHLKEYGVIRNESKVVKKRLIMALQDCYSGELSHDWLENQFLLKERIPSYELI